MIFFLTILFVFVYFTLFFCIGWQIKYYTIVDAAWGTGFACLALLSLLKTGLFLPPHILITTPVLLWSARLTTYLLIRNKGKGEDPRYIKLINSFNNHLTLRIYLQVFLLQGFFMLIMATPILVVNASTIWLYPAVAYCGALVWIIGFFFETVGDWQLYKFLQNPASHGHVMQTGVWHYTRHPNYFGEVTMWWGIYLIALSVPHGWMTILSPICITWLLLYVTGIPMTEKPMESNPEFIEYKKRTSAFFPWFSKKS